MEELDSLFVNESKSSLEVRSLGFLLFLSTDKAPRKMKEAKKSIFRYAALETTVSFR